MTDRPIKQIIVIRRDLGMRRGKEIAQGAHAAMVWLTSRLRDAPALGHFSPLLSEVERLWVEGLFTKITLQAANEEELVAVHEAAKAAGLQSHLMEDAGLTEFAGVKTKTAVGIGPDYSDRIDPVTSRLKLY